jgi:hypothetical protein
MLPAAVSLRRAEARVVGGARARSNHWRCWSAEGGQPSQMSCTTARLSKTARSRSGLMITAELFQQQERSEPLYCRRDGRVACPARQRHGKS